MFWSRCFVVILASVFFQTHVHAIEPTTSGEQLLTQMAIANRQLNYSGIFTYEHGGTLKTVKVFHAVQNEQEMERLVLLSGPKQEVIRKGSDIDCAPLGDTTLRGKASGIVNLSKHQLENYYSIQIKPDDRVAGRDIAVLHVVPLDEHRYGYVLGLDKATGLLLQSLLIGNKNRVLERFQYVDVQIGDAIDKADLEPDDGHHLVKAGASPCPSESDVFEAAVSDWQVGWLPPGYTLAGHEVAEASERETLIYTDGLSVFSLFIDPDMSTHLPQMQAQRGATVAYLSKIVVADHQYTICVVGEIPVETAKLVAQSVAPKPSLP